MALSKQPTIAIDAITRIPDDKPNSKISKGISPINPTNINKHPIIISVFPEFISNRKIIFFEVFIRYPNIKSFVINNVYL